MTRTKRTEPDALAAVASAEDDLKTARTHLADLQHRGRVANMELVPIEDAIKAELHAAGRWLRRR